MGDNPFGGLGKVNPAEPENDPVDDKVADVESDVEVADSSVRHYSCLPILRYQLGEFQFNDGYLTLQGAAADAFEEAILQQPIQEQVRIRRLSYAPGEIHGSRMIQGIDHSSNAPEGPAPIQPA